MTGLRALQAHAERVSAAEAFGDLAEDAWQVEQRFRDALRAAHRLAMLAGAQV